MIFGDIVALAKAGFTPADIREFMAASTPEKEPDKNAEKPEAKKNEPDQITKEKKEDSPDPEMVDPAEAGTSDNVYKLKYEETLEALKKAQEANRSQELPGKESDEEIFAKAALKFL